MRTTSKAFLSCAILAAALLAAGGAMAADPDPLAPQYKTCSAAGITVTTTGPEACGSNTCVTYNVTSTATPDHAGTFVRAEATLLSISGSPSVTTCNTATSAASGDGSFGLGANLLCHEKFIRWNNQTAKAKSFTYQVDGVRKPIITSVVMKKGNNQGTCQMVGVGFLDDTVGGACVSSCGNFAPKQTILKEEVLRFRTGSGKECFARFARDLATGQVVESETGLDDRSHPDCDFVRDDVTNVQLLLNGRPIGATPGDPDALGQHGDGILSTGSESCTTRIIGGRVYSWGDPCPE
jgi:hypothetical protein